eukprot:SAG11_NODE_1052_length_6029_cov_4.823946_1_plen_112_part_00
MKIKKWHNVEKARFDYRQIDSLPRRLAHAMANLILVPPSRCLQLQALSQLYTPGTAADVYRHPSRAPLLATGPFRGSRFREIYDPVSVHSGEDAAQAQCQAQAWSRKCVPQ